MEGVGLVQDYRLVLGHIQQLKLGTDNERRREGSHLEKVFTAEGLGRLPQFLGHGDRPRVHVSDNLYDVLAVNI